MGYARAWGTGFSTVACRVARPVCSCVCRRVYSTVYRRVSDSVAPASLTLRLSGASCTDLFRAGLVVEEVVDEPCAGKSLPPGLILKLFSKPLRVADFRANKR